MALLTIDGGQTLNDAECGECRESVDRVWVYQLAAEDGPHHITLCPECMARSLSLLTGFRFAGQLAAWRVTRATHEQLKAEKLARRGKRPQEKTA